MLRREAVQVLSGLASVTGLTPAHVEAIAGGRPGPSAPSQGQGFSAAQRALVERLADLIIPATDTPGAREAGAAGFIEIIVHEWYTAADADRFRRGLADVEARAQALAGVPFVEATAALQEAILTGLEAEGRVLRRERGAPTPFFHRLRGLVLSGYYSSEVGMLRELRYHAIPGRFEGCVDAATAPREDS